MKNCNKCLLPETHETIAFNSEGVCNICTQNIVVFDESTDKISIKICDFKHSQRIIKKKKN